MKNIRNKATSDNGGHTAIVLRTRTYAQIRQIRNSYVRGTLSEMPKPPKLKIRRNKNYA